MSAPQVPTIPFALDVAPNERMGVTGEDDLLPVTVLEVKEVDVSARDRRSFRPRCNGTPNAPGS